MSMILSRLLLVLVFSVMAMPAFAQGAGSGSEADIVLAREEYIYERPTYQKFSQLYWALNKLDIKDDSDIDDFMKINECSIFQQHNADQFEWRAIRESTRQYIKDNVKFFPTRFEIVQPLYLSEYDFERGQYLIWEPYQIKGSKLFEVRGAIGAEDECIGDPRKKGGIKRVYPDTVVAELSRPLTITGLEMSPDQAEILSDMKAMLAGSDGAGASGQALYQTREIYLVMRVKFFSWAGDEIGKDQISRARVLGALEGLEIYADRLREYPLYSEEFRQRSSNDMARKALLEHIEKRRQRMEGNGDGN